MGHGSMGHGSLVQWVTWVMGHKKWPIVSSDTDDIVLIAASIHQLQKLLNLTENCFLEINLKFNVKKMYGNAYW